MAKAAENPDTILVPVSGYIRMPAPSKEEREEMIAELEAISAEMQQGNYVEFEPGEFLQWMRKGIEAHRRARNK